MATSKNIVDILFKILVGCLFVVIGIEGIADIGNNALYKELSRGVDITIGAVLLVAGLLLIVPVFLKGIKPSFVTVSTIIVLVAWIIYIVLADFMYGLRGVDGEEWILWLEKAISDIIILAGVGRVASPAVKKMVK